MFVVVVRLDVNIFVLRLILRFNMFFMKVKCIRKMFLKSRKFFASWVFGPLKTPIIAIWLFLRHKKYADRPQRGYMYAKIFYSWNLVILSFKELICNYTF